MKQFIQFVKKEFLHIFRDPKTLYILFALPVIQIILFGFAMTNEVNNIDFAVLDYSHSTESLNLINKIEASNYFTLKSVLTREKDIEEVLVNNVVKLVFVIDKDFNKSVVRGEKSKIQLILDASDPNIATTIKSYVSSIISDYQTELNSGSSTQALNISTRMFYNPELKSVYQFIPGLMAFILTLISAFMTSITITKEKELGNMEILLVSPLKPFQIILGKVFPYAILSMVNITSILLLGKYIFGMPLNGSLTLLILESMLFLTTSLALGIFISSITSSRQVAMMISLAGLLLPTMFLSGFIFPIANMPVALQYFSAIFPAKYFITIVKAIMIKGVGIEYFMNETLILVGMTIFLIVVSIKKFKVRLD